MIQKTLFSLYILLFAMLFSTFAVSGQAPPTPQAEPLAEATFYVH
jgi:hypothetical protein